MGAKFFYRDIDLVYFVTNKLINNNLINQKDRVLLSFSGGQDSICFVFILNQLCYQLELNIMFFWCHHLWQTDSFYLMQQIAKLSFLFQFNSCFAIPLNFISSELLARKWRQSCSYRVSLFYNYSKICLAHTFNDKIENIFLNFMRGTGLIGLAPLRWIQFISKPNIANENHISRIFDTFQRFPLLTPSESENPLFTRYSVLLRSKGVKECENQHNYLNYLSLKPNKLNLCIPDVPLVSKSNICTAISIPSKEKLLTISSYSKEIYLPMAQPLEFYRLHTPRFAKEVRRRGFSDQYISNILSFLQSKTLRTQGVRKASSLQSKDLRTQGVRKSSSSNGCAIGRYIPLEYPYPLAKRGVRKSPINFCKTLFCNCPLPLQGSIDIRNKSVKSKLREPKESKKFSNPLGTQNFVIPRSKAQLRTGKQSRGFSNPLGSQSFALQRRGFSDPFALLGVTDIPRFAKGYKGRGNILNNLLFTIETEKLLCFPQAGIAKEPFSKAWSKSYESLIDGSYIVRPLLSISRIELNKICYFWELPIYPDTSNQKVRFLRNRVRQQLLPVIKLFFNLNIENIFLQLAKIIEIEDYCLTQIVNEFTKNTDVYHTKLDIYSKIKK